MKTLSKEQAIVVSAYTGFLICDFGDLHKYIEEKMGRPVMSHEMGSDEFMESLREVCKRDFVSLLPEEYKEENNDR